MRLALLNAKQPSAMTSDEMYSKALAISVKKIVRMSLQGCFTKWYVLLHYG